MKKFFITFIFLSAQVLANNECTLDLNKRRKASDYNYILVSGILNELLPFYMNEYVDYLISLKVPKKQIIRVNASSLLDPFIASKSLEETINEINNNKKIVFISHSKGALETLYYLNNEKDNVAAKVEKAFLIQGALDGSSLYKAFYDVKEIGFIKRAIKWMVGDKFPKPFNYRFVRKNLLGIKNKKELLKKITFITSEVTYDKLPFKYKMVGDIYQSNFKRSGDGVLMRSDHIPFELSSELDKLCVTNYDVHHAYLVTAAPWDSEHLQDIRDFLKSLFFKKYKYIPKYLK